MVLTALSYNQKHATIPIHMTWLAKISKVESQYHTGSDSVKKAIETVYDHSRNAGFYEIQEREARAKIETDPTNAEYVQQGNTASFHRCDYEEKFLAGIRQLYFEMERHEISIEKKEQPHEAILGSDFTTLTKEEKDELKGHEMHYMVQAAVVMRNKDCVADHTTELGFEKAKRIIESTATSRKPIGSSSKAEQSDEAVIKRHTVRAYTSEDEQNSGSFYCPVTRQKLYRDVIVAAHIIPTNTPPQIISYLFGQSVYTGASVLDDTTNIMLVHPDIEEAMDKGKITFRPVECLKFGGFADLALPQEYEVQILDLSLLSKPRSGSFGADWKQIARQPRLRFRTKARPGLRNILLHYITSLWAAKFNQWPGWENRKEVVFDRRWKSSALGAICKTFLSALSRESGIEMDFDSGPSSRPVRVPPRASEDEETAMAKEVFIARARYSHFKEPIYLSSLRAQGWEDESYWQPNNDDHELCMALGLLNSTE